MKNLTFDIKNISLLSPDILNAESLLEYFKQGVFQDKSKFDTFLANSSMLSIAGLLKTPLKKRMSDLTKGICATLECSILPTLQPDEEIYLFSAFAEIETTNKIIGNIMIDKSLLVSPTLFHNSVHNTPLGYFTVSNKIHNYCTTISDGLDTNKSFTDFLSMRLQLNDRFIITAGEECSDFFNFDTTKKLSVRPVFVSFRAEPSPNAKTATLLSTHSIDQINLNDYDNIFADYETFSKLCDNRPNIYTDYPLTRDNPTAVVVRLILPILLGLQGRTLIIDKNKSNYTFFEVIK